MGCVKALPGLLAWAPQGSSREAAKSGSPHPSLAPSPTTAVRVGRHLPDPPEQWAGEGAGASGASQGRGPRPQAARQRSLPTVAVLHLTQFPQLWGPCRARRTFPGCISLSSGHFNVTLDKLLVLLLLGKPPVTPLRRLLLPRSVRQVGDARCLNAPNFPHWRPTVLASPSTLLAKP